MVRFYLCFYILCLGLSSGHKALAQTTVFLRAGGDITTPGDWGTSADGLSGTLSDFSQNNTYNFSANNASRSLSSAWNITAGSTVVLGDGTNGFTLTYSGSATMGSTPANVSMNNLSRLVLNTNYNLDASKTTFNSGSTIEYAAGTSSVTGDIYQNLVISNNVSSNGAVIQIIGTFVINSGNVFTFNNNSDMTIAGGTTIDGTISGNGTGIITLQGGGFPVLFFTPGASSIASLTILGTSGISNVTVTSTFSLEAGIFSFVDLELNGDIFFKSNATAVMSGGLTSNLTIGGSGTISNNLIMNNNFVSSQSLNNLFVNRSGANLNLGNTLRIWGSLTPSVGTITTNSNLILENDATRKGRIGPLSASGNLSGDVTVNLFKPADVTGWNNLCSSGVTGKTMADWNNSFVITCPTCPDGNIVNGANFTSIYNYNEVAPTATSASDPIRYIALSGISVSIDSKTGYWVYLGNDFPNSSAITIPLSGAVNTKTSSGNYTLTLTGTAGTENGWNLIANPYPSPIQVSQFISSAGALNIDNTLLVYDPTTDSNVPLTSGNVIPMGQAFMVRALVNNTSVTPDETWKTATADNTSIQKQIAESVPMGSNGRSYYFNEFLIDLNSNNVAKNFFTQAYFTFGNGASQGFDNGKDAYSLESSVDPGTPRLFSISNNEHFLRNALPAISGSIAIPLMVSTGYSGQYSLKAINLNKLPAGACVVLHDLLSSSYHDLKSGPYTTTINAWQTGPQFELIITILPASMSSQTQDPLCTNGLDGAIVASGNGTGPWNYTWKNANATVLKYSPNSNGADTLNQLSPGLYMVDVNAVGTCNNASTQFTLTAQTPLPIADFAINTSTISAHANVPVSFTNLSQNASEFTWEFGNGVNVSSFHTNFTYNIPGLYTVKLIAGNGACQDFNQKSIQIQVLDMPLGIAQNKFTTEELILVKDGSSLYIDLNSNETEEFDLTVYNTLGQNLIMEKNVRPVNGRINIQISTSENLIFVKLNNENRGKTFKVIH